MLPKGYKKLEYLQNAAPGSFFDIGIVPDIGTQVTFDGMTVNGDTALFGARTSMGANDKFALQFVSENVYRISFQNQQKSAPTTYATGKRYVFDVSRNGFYIDGSLISRLDAPYLVGRYPFYVLACNTAGVMTNPGINRIYSMQVYEDGALISNLIPCKNEDAVAGLYDTVRGIFFADAGRGGFLGQDEQLVSIDVTRAPDKTVYFLGEQLDTAGLILMAKYASGYKEPITAYDMSGFDSGKPGSQRVTVAYAGYTSSFEVTVYGEEPPKELVTLKEMKQYLRVDFEDEDALITDLIQTAQRLCLDVLRCADVSSLPEVESAKAAVLYSVAYLYEHREEADHHALVLTLRSLLFGSRREVF